MYKEYCPHILLSSYVETYWISNAYVEGEQSIRIMPDGCVDILFNCGCATQNGLKPFTPYLNGIMTASSEVLYVDTIQMMGIRFRPCGISAFTRVPINEFTNIKVDVSLFETLFDESFYMPLLEIGDEIERIHYIDKYLVKLSNKTFTPDKQIHYVVDLISQSKGTIPINKVLDNVCLCQRQFERKFKIFTGVTPKMFSSIIRFANTQKVLHNRKDESLFSIALDCGYYDHAHLLKEYKRFSGSYPIVKKVDFIHK